VNSLPLMPIVPAVCLVGVSRRRAAQPHADYPVWNISKARPRRVWRGFCHHDRSFEGQGICLLLNMFRGVSTVITPNATSKLPPILYLMTVPRLRDGTVCKNRDKPINLPSVLGTGGLYYNMTDNFVISPKITGI
jgi:hypothetical protein